MYALISGIILFSGAYSLIRWQLNLSIDFTGGTVIEYALEKTSQEELLDRFTKNNPDVLQSFEKADSRVALRTKPIFQEQARIEGASILRFENVGPTLSAEILRKTIIAIAIAAGGILLWVTWQFKSFQFGVSAIMAMIHDSLVLVGSFSLLGHFYKAPVDTLFVTALLTTLAFSVHDTIVVFDRVREIKKKIGGQIWNIANLAVSQTMVRSLNNSLTIIFVLVALALLGGSTLFWFVIALLIGTITGTYSSPFVAVPLLVTWEKIRSLYRK